MFKTNRIKIHIKTIIKNGVWFFLGHRYANPNIPFQTKRILFLCLGNICRSAYAHHYANVSLIGKNIDHIEIFSAGLTVKDMSSPSIAIRIAGSRGIDLHSHVPVQVSKRLVQKSDIVLAMEPKQIQLLKSKYPEYSDKFFLLSLFHKQLFQQDSWNKYHIADPYGRSNEEFSQCFAKIECCVDSLLSSILNQCNSSMPANDMKKI